MVLVDKKILSGGLAMLIVGITIMAYLGSVSPIWNPEMTEEQASELPAKQRTHQEYSTLAAILAGLGFLLVLISFGARKKKGGAKTIEKKPPEVS